MAEAYQRQSVYAFSYRRSADQDAAEPVTHPVIVVGAGPIGLAAAIDLGQRGVPVVLLDDADRIGEGSRGLCYSKRSLEILDRLGAAKDVVEKGVTWQLGKVFFRDDQVYQFDLLPEGGHKMPAFVNLQQYYLEKYMVDRAAGLDEIEIRWSNRVTGVEQDGEAVTVTIETPDGPYKVRAQYLIAADGARSTVRELLGLDFVGKIFQDKFLIADVRMEADFPAERRFWFEPPFSGGQSALLHKQADDVWRLDFQIGWDADSEEETKPENVERRVRQMLKGRNYELVWVSVYTFQCKRLEKFRHGRILFAGDAAHQVSPFGARGANTGFEDSDNLGWKLERVLSGSSPDSLLDTYDLERVQAADYNIGHSTRSTDFITPKSRTSKYFRDGVLQLSRKAPFAQAMVNSGRLSDPATIDSPLNTPDTDAFAGSARLGRPVPDAPLVDAEGNERWLTNCFGNDFTLLYVEDRVPAPEVEGMDVLVVGRDVLDKDGYLARRFDATPGACYLIRPDHHLAARWRQFDQAKVAAAFDRATGRAA